MADLFKEIIASIITTKQRPDDIDGYVPYVINWALSNHMDCILYANEMNLASFIPNQMQYDYFFHSVRKGKRKFTPFEKKLSLENVSFVKEYFGCSTIKAKELLKVLTEQQLKTIVTTLDKGGNTK